MKNNNINIVEKCTGCNVCGDICPKNAISYILSNKGFLIPKIDLKKCINCGLCINACPQNNKKTNKILNGFVCWSNDKEIYNKSASGGIFSEIATRILKDKGVVYGAAFEKMKVKHIKITKIEDLKLLQKSKYVQSYAGGVYNDCKKELNKGKKVLFSGTPCQISALKNFLNKDYENLLLCDLICHGVPSQHMFDKFIKYEEEQRGGKIIEFQFRYKLNRPSAPQTFKYVLRKKNKNIIKKGNYYEFPYLFGFQKYLFLRESCYSCNYANNERCGDITLGDFWTKADYYKKEKGLSMVITNTKKGLNTIDEIRKYIEIYEADINDLLECNDCLSRPTEKNKNEEDFYKLYKKDIGKAIDKYLTPKHKVVLDIYYILPTGIKTLIKKIIKKDKIKKMW